ncbi:MAG: hypothetical protein JSR21_08010 [Proteobacteria bacterium]|nr:hypothetical protein [Pseudomonadota bacterium]
MNGEAIGAIFAVSAFASTMAGLWMGQRFIGRQLTDQTRSTIGRVSGLMSAIIGLVLGLLISSSYSFYNSEKTDLDLMTAHIIALDGTLAAYGPEAAAGREVLRVAMDEAYRSLSASSAASSITDLTGVTHASEDLQAALGSLQPKTGQQSRLVARAAQLTFSINDMRELLSLHQLNSLPIPFVVILGSWTAALFFGFGLLGRANSTTVLSLAVGSAGVGSALFLIEAMRQPFSGALKLSLSPLEQAIAALSH